MQTTTKIKIFLKKYLPAPISSAIHVLYNNTLLKIQSFIFASKIHAFKKREIMHLTYFHKSFDLIIDPKNGFLDQQLFAYHAYEPHIVKEIYHALKEGDTAIDIGANIGHHSMFMSLCVGKNGSVLAFEPIPYIRKQFEESIELNGFGNITVFPYAIGDKEKKDQIHLLASNVGASSILENDSGGVSIPISIKTLDHFFTENITFIKLDVEGYEYHALYGAQRIMQTLHPTILMEYSPAYYKTYDKTHSKKIIALVRENGYQIYDLEDGRKKITDDEAFVASFDKGLRSQTNILCVKE